MNFPLITWSDTVGPINVDGSAPPAPYNAAQTRFGFGINSTTLKTAAADTAADYLRGSINAVYPGMVSAVEFVYLDGPGPSNSPLQVKYTYAVPVAGVDVVINFGTTPMAQKFGFNTTTVTFFALYTEKFTTINPGMFWGPAGLAGDVRRMLTQRAASSSSDMSGLTTEVVNWGAVADLEMMSTMFCAANYTRWFANIQIYANAANRVLGDPNNTLEGLIEAAAEGKTFRLYREAATIAGTVPGTYQVCRMPTVSNKGSAEDFATAADEPRLWSTSGLVLRGET